MKVVSFHKFDNSWFSWLVLTIWISNLENKKHYSLKIRNFLKIIYNFMYPKFHLFQKLFKLF